MCICNVLLLTYLQFDHIYKAIYTSRLTLNTLYGLNVKNIYPGTQIPMLKYCFDKNMCNFFNKMKWQTINSTHIFLLLFINIHFVLNKLLNFIKICFDTNYQFVCKTTTYTKSLENQIIISIKCRIISLMSDTSPIGGPWQ